MRDIEMRTDGPVCKDMVITSTPLELWNWTFWTVKDWSGRLSISH